MPAVIHGQFRDVYETGAAQLYPLGQKLATPDGSVFRYAKMGATVGVAANLYQSEASNAGWVSELLPSPGVVAGDTTILIADTAAAYAANVFAGGTVIIEETASLGHTYPIKSNAASAGSASAVHTLADGVTVQVTVANGGGVVTTLMKNPWRDVILGVITNPTAMAAGIPRVIVAAAEFGWLQTRGVASCLVVGTWVVGDRLAAGLTAAGGIGPSGAATDPSIAVAMLVGVVADFGHCFLTID